MIEEVVINYINEELGSCTVYYHRPCHSKCAFLIFQPVSGLILYLCLCRLLLHVWCKSTTLDHEIADDPVKYRPVIELIIHICKKIVYTYWCILLVQLYPDITH